MRFDLASQIRRPSKRPIALPPIITTQAQANSLATIYQHVVRGWQEAAPMIVDSYDRQLQQKLQTDSIDQTGAVIDVIAEAMQRLVMVLTPNLRNWAFDVERWHRGKFARGVLSGAGLDITTQIGPEDARETVEAVVQRNVALVRDVSEEIRARVADAVFRGYQKATPARELGKEINEAVGLGRKRSNRIAADQTVKLSSALDAERQRQAGLDHWKWRHSGKLHPRLEHKARDRKVYTDKTAPADLPGELPYCGCVRQGVIVFDDDD